MRTDELRRLVDETWEALTTVKFGTLNEKLREERNGYPSSTLGGFGGGQSDDTPTEAAALKVDRASADWHRFDGLVRQMHRVAGDIAKMDIMWLAPPRRAQCWHCGRATEDHKRTHCVMCAEFHTENGRLPTPEELADLVTAWQSKYTPSGQRVRKRAT